MAEQELSHRDQGDERDERLPYRLAGIPAEELARLDRAWNALWPAWLDGDWEQQTPGERYFDGR